MFTYRPRRGPHPRPAARKPAARLHRITAATAAVICGVLAPLAIIPAASATTLVPHPDPGGFGGITPLAPVRAASVRVVTAGGMAGWQIAVIALGAALAAAAAAVLLDRALAARRAAPALTATGHGQPRPDEISSPPAWR
jgi:hypothetical protein